MINVIVLEYIFKTSIIILEAQRKDGNSNNNN